MKAESLRVVPRAQGLDRIRGHCGRRRDLGQQPAVRSSESKRAVGLSIDLKALFVHRSVMSTTEHREIRKRSRPAVGPVSNVMSLAEGETAAWEATALVTMVERTPQRRGNRPGPGPDLHGAAVVVVPHHHAARVARQAPRRFL